MVLLTVPFYLHPVQLGPMEVSLTEAAIVFGCAGLGVRAVACRALGLPAQLSRPVPGAIDWIAAAFLLGGLLSLLPTEYPKQSLRELRWLILEPIALFYVVRVTIRTPGQELAILGALVLAGVMASLAAVGDLAIAGSVLDPSARAMAPYRSPNQLGLFLERSGTVALALALFGPRPALGWASASIIGVALARSLSLGAWLGFGCAAVALAALRGRRWLLTSAAVVLFGLVAALAVLPHERTLERLDPATGTGLIRLQVWTSALRMAADHPVLGVGLDNFLYLYRDAYILPEAWREPNLSHPHNWVLHFWLQLGLLGLGAAMASIGWIYIRAHRRFSEPRTPLDRLVAAATAGALITFLVHGFFDNSYFLVDLAAVWWVLAGLLALEPEGRASSSGDGQPSPVLGPASQAGPGAGGGSSASASPPGCRPCRPSPRGRGARLAPSPAGRGLG